jgi:hypothetical protein
MERWWELKISSETAVCANFAPGAVDFAGQSGPLFISSLVGSGLSPHLQLVPGLSPKEPSC